MKKPPAGGFLFCRPPFLHSLLPLSFAALMPSCAKDRQMPPPCFIIDYPAGQVFSRDFCKNLLFSP